MSNTADSTVSSAAVVHDTAAGQEAKDSQIDSHVQDSPGVPSVTDTSILPSEGAAEGDSGGRQSADPSDKQSWEKKFRDLHPETSYSTHTPETAPQGIMEKLRSAGVELPESGGHGDLSKEQLVGLGLKRKPGKGTEPSDALNPNPAADRD